MINERITIAPNICHGKLCIKGTRIPVCVILNLLAAGETHRNILKAYPHLTKADIAACVKYATEVTTLETLLVK